MTRKILFFVREGDRVVQGGRVKIRQAALFVNTLRMVVGAYFGVVVVVLFVV